jgi:hypothetical protein
MVLLILSVLLLSMPQCARKTAELPKDLLSFYIGMNEQDARKHLQEIGEFERNDRRRQQLWRLKNDSHYSHLAIAFDKDNQVRYITAFADKAKERIRYSDIGDISKAKEEITEQHHRYTWEAASAEGKPAYFVILYGNETEFLSSVSLSKKIVSGEEEEE